MGDAGSESASRGTLGGAAGMTGGPMEDILEVAEGLDGGFAHVGRNLIV